MFHIILLLTGNENLEFLQNNIMQHELQSGRKRHTRYNLPQAWFVLCRERTSMYLISREAQGTFRGCRGRM